jgi:hypothetical protein
VTTTRAVVIAVLLAGGPARAETVYCSTSFQGYRICSGPGGYRSTEWDRDGMLFEEDSDGNRWTTSRWQGLETTTVEGPYR